MSVYGHVAHVHSVFLLRVISVYGHVVHVHNVFLICGCLSMGVFCRFDNLILISVFSVSGHVLSLSMDMCFLSLWACFAGPQCLLSHVWKSCFVSLWAYCAASQ